VLAIKSVGGSSYLHGAPVLIWPVARPTARSAIKESSVSPDLWLAITPHPASCRSEVNVGVHNLLIPPPPLPLYARYHTPFIFAHTIMSAAPQRNFPNQPKINWTSRYCQSLGTRSPKALADNMGLQMEAVYLCVNQETCKFHSD
jgi:hypothetical protein